MQDRQIKVEMVWSSRLLYLICYMLKKIDFQKHFECAEPFCRNTNFAENKWRPTPASSWSWSWSCEAGADCPLVWTVYANFSSFSKLLYKWSISKNLPPWLNVLNGSVVIGDYCCGFPILVTTCNYYTNICNLHPYKHP